jgi:hypothetical protein
LTNLPCQAWTTRAPRSRAPRARRLCCVSPLILVRLPANVPARSWPHDLSLALRLGSAVPLSCAARVKGLSRAPGGAAGVRSYPAARALGFPPPPSPLPRPSRAPPHPPDQKRLRFGSAVKSIPSAAIIISLNRIALTNLRLEPELGSAHVRGLGGDAGDRGVGTRTGRGGLGASIVCPYRGTERGSRDPKGEIVLAFPSFHLKERKGGRGIHSSRSLAPAAPPPPALSGWNEFLLMN